MGPGDDVPARSKLITTVSFLSWTGVLVSRRLLTFYRPEFMHH
ncbi:hypothetical protein PVW47_14470 [Marinovum sp. SP66]|nr:hypothetical protein [Marinovum sp. SP66]MDD9740980.1 hypothetical protein [Marinovum sp. SP66]